MTTRARRDATNLDAIGHPVTLVCAAALALNDHVGKEAWPGWWTGKLSDFAFCAILPVVIAAGLSPRTQRGRPVAVLLTVVLFTALQLWPALGAAINPRHVADPGDLVALPFVALAWLAWRGRPRWWAPVLAVPVLASLVATTEYRINTSATWPCATGPARWPTGDALLLIRVWHAPVPSENFYEGVSLVGEDGTAEQLVVADLGGDMVAVCAFDGLTPNTTYQWSVGPWEPTHREVQFADGPGVDITFTTDDAPGVRAESAEACARLANVPEEGLCPRLQDDTGDTAPMPETGDTGAP